MGLARHAQITEINLQYLYDIVRKKSGMKNKDLTALAGSDTTLTIYYTFNILPPLTCFFSQYGIHTKPLLHLINCLCNISLLLFEVTVGPCKLACFSGVDSFMWFWMKCHMVFFVHPSFFGLLFSWCT